MIKCLLSETDIQVDWEIYNIDENDHTLIELVNTYGDHFPLKDDDGNELLKGTFRVFNENDPTEWEKNQTPTLVGTSMSLQSGTVSISNSRIQILLGT